MKDLVSVPPLSYRIEVVNIYHEVRAVNYRSAFRDAKALFARRCREFPKCEVVLWANGGGKWHKVKEY